jgi:amidophosphoribosyltransferase
MGHGDLMAARLSIDEIRDHIGADSLGFLSLDGMNRAIVGVDANGQTSPEAEGFCNACYTGHYPIEVSQAQPKLGFEGVLA